MYATKFVRAITLQDFAHVTIQNVQISHVKNDVFRIIMHHYKIQKERK